MGEGPLASATVAVAAGAEAAGTPGSARIARGFAERRGRAALMPYVMGGFPDLDVSLRVADACADAGADLLELGVPFSDPLADGPAIHAAATRALAAGATVDGVLGVCEQAARRLPVVLMTYANTVLASGPERFLDHARAAGASGVIVPDLPHDEADGMRAACDAAGLALVPLVAPNTTSDRLRSIARTARGFVYTVSVAGTTGERGDLPPGLAATVERVRAATAVPVAVGFGISTEEQAAQVGGMADGVIVGSRIVRATEEGGPAAVSEVVRALGEALR